jgi:hypothetical protein
MLASAERNDRNQWATWWRREVAALDKSKATVFWDALEI